MAEQLPTISGLGNILEQNVIFERDDEISSTEIASKVVKLRFTSKQYMALRDACNIFQVIAENENFPQFVAKVMNSEIPIRPASIKKQLITPIVTAPTKIIITQPRKAGNTSYFTKPVPVSKEAKKLYDAVKKDIDTNILKQDFTSGVTSVVDIKYFLKIYIQKNDLENNSFGIEVTKGLTAFAPNAIKQLESVLLHNEDKSYIPQKNKMKMMSAYASDILTKK